MSECPKCGVARRYVGVAFPVRRLCKCESRDCGKCGAAAVFVEFQSPIKNGEPKLPIETNPFAIFSCAKHAPDDIPEEIVEPSAAPKKKKGGRPHIDPVWAAATSSPPPGSRSREKVICSACNLTHELRERVMWNGTHSECPVETCRHDMFVMSWEDS